MHGQTWRRLKRIAVVTLIWKLFRLTLFQSSFLSFVTFEMLGREINLFYTNLWYCHSQTISQLPLLTKWTWQPWQSPFKRQYLHADSPNWSLYISLLNPLREFDKRSEHFSFVIILLTLITFSIDDVLILFGENWGWSLLGLNPLGPNFKMQMFSFVFLIHFQ